MGLMVDACLCRDEFECKVVDQFLESHGVELVKRDKILSIINRMGKVALAIKRGMRPMMLKFKSNS